MRRLRLRRGATWMLFMTNAALANASAGPDTPAIYLDASDRFYLTDNFSRSDRPTPSQVRNSVKWKPGDGAYMGLAGDLPFPPSADAPALGNCVGGRTPLCSRGGGPFAAFCMMTAEDQQLALAPPRPSDHATSVSRPERANRPL